jgi:hypothetical protein
LVGQENGSTVPVQLAGAKIELETSETRATRLRSLHRLPQAEILLRGFRSAKALFCVGLPAGKCHCFSEFLRSEKN